MDNALIIFTRNPELGNCKTRLAKTVGDKSALAIYNYLLQHTVKITKQAKADCYVFYSEEVLGNDIWEPNYFNKKLQKGKDLGERMQNAFQEIFNLKYTEVILIGSDLLDLNASIIEQAYSKLKQYDFVLGPAKDGGYYLLGMKTIQQSVFKNKKWGTATVKKDTLNDLKKSSVYLLQELNDIDTFEDMKHYKELTQFHKKDA